MMTKGFGEGIPGDIYDHAPGYGCKAHDQAAYERDMQTNKITLDPVLPELGGVGGPVGAELSRPLPGYSEIGEGIRRAQTPGVTNLIATHRRR
jgi:hypothetical protein